MPQRNPVWKYLLGFHTPVTVIPGLRATIVDVAVCLREE